MLILTMGCFSETRNKKPIPKDPCIIYTSYGYEEGKRLCYYKGWEVINKYIKTGVSTTWVMQLKNPETSQHANYQNKRYGLYNYYSIGDTI